MKFFLVGETDPRLTGDRFFTEAKSEQEARSKFYDHYPGMAKRAPWLVKVKEISEKDFREKRA
jgi:hypothetical protein